MKDFTHKFFRIFALLFLIGFISNAQDTVDFSFTGAVQYWEVPCGVTEIQVEALGASGQTSSSGYGGNIGMGKGGKVECTLAVTPRQLLRIYVGGSLHYSPSSPTRGPGWNGGGAPGVDYDGGRGGGGATDIRISGSELTDRVIVAGGGGGSCNNIYMGGYTQGGHGGGLSAQNGSYGARYGYGSPYQSGQGATQTEAGQPGTGSEAIPGLAIGGTGTAGSFGVGGNGGGLRGSGGGGGYYGGGGGASADGESWGGGGGGSSYTDSALVSNVIHTQGVQTGNGSLTISYTVGEIEEECGYCNGDILTLTSTGSGSISSHAWFTGDQRLWLGHGDKVYGANGNSYTVSSLSFPDGGANTTKITFTSSVEGVFTYGNSYQTDVSSCVVEGCTVGSAENYMSDANTNDGSCIVYGCTSNGASNYNSIATIDDNSCLFPGCMDSLYLEFDENANIDDESCLCPVALDLNINILSENPISANVSVEGGASSGLSPDEFAEILDENHFSAFICTNYDGFGVGEPEFIEACSYLAEQLNYNGDPSNLMNPYVYYCSTNQEPFYCEVALSYISDGIESNTYQWFNPNGELVSNDAEFNAVGAGLYTLKYNANDCQEVEMSFEIGTSILGCTNEIALNYNEDANTNDGSCIIEGCIDENAFNYFELATLDDGSCIPIYLGCTDLNAFNYSADANTDDGSCVDVINGCVDENAFNYDENANTDDGSCIDVVNGCLDSSMSNYNSEANTEDGSCVSWEELANNIQSELDNVVPEDGVSQEDVEAAFAAGAASVTPEDGITQSDVDAAYAAGVASVEILECEEVITQNMPLDLPEGWSMFGYTCLESLDVIEAFSGVSSSIEIVKDEWGLAYLPAWSFSAFDSLEFGEGYQIKMIEALTDFQFCTTIVGGSSQEELDAAYAEGAASITPDDGITLAMLNDANEQLMIVQEQLINVQDELNNMSNNNLGSSGEAGFVYPPENYSEYWSYVDGCMGGNAYECVEATKFLWEYNSSFIPSEIENCVDITLSGYVEWEAQSACLEALNSPASLGEFFGVSSNCVDFNQNGICDIIELTGCMDPSAFNYNDQATAPGECIPYIEGCMDVTACNYSSEANVNSGCTFPILDGENWLNCDLQVGHYYGGGVVFQVNDDNTGLTVALENLTYPGAIGLRYDMALEAAGDFIVDEYDDWYLPSKSEWDLIADELANQNEYLGLGFGYKQPYWSTTLCNNLNHIYLFYPINDSRTECEGPGSTTGSLFGNNADIAARAIRAF